MRNFFTRLGRFTTKLVSLLVICGFISLACLPIVHAAEGDDSTGAGADDILDSSAGCRAKPSEGEITTVSDEGTEEPSESTDTSADTGAGTETDPSDTPVEYTVTLKYSGTDLTEPNDVLLCKAGKYRFTAKEIEGYTAQEESIVAEIDQDKTNEVTFSYDKNTAPVTMGTLTIKYHYVDDPTRDTIDDTKKYEVGKDYEITISDVEGYTTTITVDSDPIGGPIVTGTVVTGTMVKGGVEVTVTYTKNTTEEPKEYTITIQYQDTSNKEIENAPSSTTVTRTAGEHTFYPIDIPGYEKPESQTITVSENTTITFTYRKIYTITIQYHDKEGNELHSDKTENYVENSHVTIKPEVIEGYTTPDNKTIDDVPEDNKITFIYEKSVNVDDNNQGDNGDTGGTGDDNQGGGSGDTGSDNPGNNDNNNTTPGDTTDPSDDPKDPDSPKDPTDPGQKPSDQNPSDQKPADQQPGNQGSISLPTAGPSDAMIRDFLILDAEVSAGGIGLWAISGVIRKIRRH